ncbi:PilY2 family type 4a fimbrial biogenesis protein [Metapseudomonas otitidis]|uniref:PilY2 family type 4a fimbrial biogenesis protein n=1 Tax=Metapseudomonas otitidis TaxID=319939 RepID=UPI001AAEBD06|nr:PilY2 family type 4a fimbrial biogenesis protein [Pseudomonas otitidis]MBO2929640.1 PilY2 family type 4a fimbrial biogenesis protein [Pseudomonas otitidis]
MKSTLSYLSYSLLAYSIGCFASDFEDGGVVQEVDVPRNIVLVDGASYHLPNSVKESSAPTGLPAIMQLEKGMYVFFYCKDSSKKEIDSISIHSRRAAATTDGKWSTDEQ